MAQRVVIVGAGITGLTTAFSIKSARPDFDVTVLEASSRFGGNIRTTPFAGLPAVDEGPDAFLVRVPFAVQLAKDLGFSEDDMTSPATGSAYVWHKKLHAIPGGLMLGVPGEVLPIAKSGLLSPLGKLRAAIEPLLPQIDAKDSIGRLIRGRFGNEVHERLVDPLIGSIYASDTDQISIHSVPQLAALSDGSRSLLLAVRKQRKTAPAMGPGSVFTTPRDGVGAIIDALVARCNSLGVKLISDCSVTSIERGYLVHSESGSYPADQVVVASPAARSAQLFAPLDSFVEKTLNESVHVGVTIVSLAVPNKEFPAHLTGSGYLIPKSDQNKVTAVSFASNKWAHWRPDDTKILRVSLGQDGNPVGDLDEDAILKVALSDLHKHLGVAFNPSASRISRWADAFPQYRPGHFDRVAKVEASLAESSPGVFVAGASHRGIGIPACVQQARAAAEKVVGLASR